MRASLVVFESKVAHSTFQKKFADLSLVQPSAVKKPLSKMTMSKSANKIGLSLGSLLLAACLAITSGCSCEEEKEESPADTSLPPLEIQGTPTSVQAEVYPLLGSTKTSPVVLVLAEDPNYCGKTRTKFAATAHVLCSLPTSQDKAQPDAEAKLRAALVFLKKSYTRYLASSPVLLITGPIYAEVGFKMMLAEPKFFAHAYLAGFDSSALTNTLLAALHGKGAKTLLLDGTMDSGLRLLSTAAGRAHLSVQTVGSGPEALDRALDLLSEADSARLTASAPKPGQPNSASP